MAFKDEVLSFYRPARVAAANGDVATVAQKIKALGDLCERQYSLGVDGCANRAKLRYYYEKFYNYSAYIEKNGLTHEIKVFFGIVNDSNLPSFGDILREGDNLTPKVVDPVDFLGNTKKSNEEYANNSKDCNQIEPVTLTNDNEIIENLSTVPIVDNNQENGKNGRIAENVFDPETLGSFIGQKRVVERIQAEISAAKKRGEKHLDHILLFGSRGLGKSTLMKLIAKELGVRFEFLDCSQFRNDVSSQTAAQNFLQNIARRNEPVVIGFDEIGFCPKQVQASLLTLLNDRSYSWLDKSGKSHNVPIDEFTFIGATTDPQDLLPTLKDRCRNLTFYLSDYTRDELRQIFLNKFVSKNLLIDDKALLKCINRCRSSIREVNSFVKGLDTIALNADTNFVTLEMTAEYFSNMGLDQIGLSSIDLNILNALLNDQSGVMAEDTIAARAGLDTKVYHSEYEPYLLKIGFISISGKGRSLTEKAVAYLKDGTYAFGDENVDETINKIVDDVSIVDNDDAV